MSNELKYNQELILAAALLADSGNMEYARLWAKGFKLEWKYASQNDLCWSPLSSLSDVPHVDFVNPLYKFRLAPKSITIKHWVVVDFTNNETTVRKTEKTAKLLQQRLERVGYKTKLVEITQEVTA